MQKRWHEKEQAYLAEISEFEDSVKAMDELTGAIDSLKAQRNEYQSRTKQMT